MILGVAVSLIEMLESQLKDLKLDDVLHMMQDPQKAPLELLLTQSPIRQPVGCCEEKECADGEGGGGVARVGQEATRTGEKSVGETLQETGESRAAMSMSAVLMQRGIAITHDAQVLAEVQEEYNL